MKQKIVIRFLLLTLVFGMTLIVFPAMAQTIDFQWAKSWGSTTDDAAYDMAIDQSGNVFIAGSFQGTVDFDPGPGTATVASGATGYNIYLSKFDNAGNFIWVKTIIGSSGEEATAIHIDGSGNIYLTGYYGGTVDFDWGAGVNNMTAIGANDVFVAKYDNNANYLWSKSVGGTASEAGRDIVSDNNGNVIIGGYFNGTVDFDPGPGTASFTSVGTGDVFFLKLDVSGNYQWSYRLGSLNAEDVSSVVTDDNNNIYFIGKFTGTCDLDPTGGNNSFTSAGGSDIWILKLDQNGNHFWTKVIGGTSNDESFSAEFDQINMELIMAGSFRSTVDFDPGAGLYSMTSSGFSSAFIGKYDLNGGIVWAKTFDGIGIKIAYDLSIDVNHEIVATGYISTGGTGNIIDFDSGAGTYTLSTTGDACVFLWKLDVNGNNLWATMVGGSIDDRGKEVATDQDANIFGVGYFNASSDFDPGTNVTTLTSNGGDDTYFLKFMICNATYSSINPVVCGEYVSPGGITYTTSGTFNDTIINNNGCDSIITINLTVNPLPSVSASASPSSSVCSGTQVTLNGTGALNYMWTGGVTNGVPFTPMSSGTYQVTGVDTNGCSTMTSIFINVIQPPAPNNIIANFVACQGVGSDILLNCQPSSGFYTFNWTFSDPSGTIGGSTTNSNTLTINSTNVTGTIMVTLTDINGCVSASTSYFLSAGPFAPFAPVTGITSDNVCPGSNRSYSAVPMQGVSGYVWSYSGTGASLNPSVATVNVFFSDTVASGNICVYATNGVCNGATSCIVINVLPESTGYQMINLCYGESVNIDSHTYDSSGIYQDTLIAYNGCDSVLTTELLIEEAINTTVISSGDSLIADLDSVNYQWIDCENGLPVIGATDKIFKVETPGSYAVILYSESCSDTSDCFEILLQEIIGEIGIGPVLFYPNPTNGIVYLHFQGGKGQDTEARIYDLLGKLILECKKINGNEIDLSELSDGIYFIETKYGKVRLMLIR